jgi:hypothetical protein
VETKESSQLTGKVTLTVIHQREAQGEITETKMTVIGQEIEKVLVTKATGHIVMETTRTT